MAYDTLDLALKAAAETTQDTSKTNAVHNTTVMGLIDKMFLSHTAAIWSKVEAFESGMADIDPDAPDIDPTSGMEGLGDGNSSSHCGRYDLVC